MEAQTLITSFSPSLQKSHFAKPSIFKLPQSNTVPNLHFPSITSKNLPKLRTHSTPSSSSSSAFVTEKTETDIKSGGEQFDWYSQWYPVTPVCELDKKVPHGKKVMGIDVVVWWDRNENKWKVFDDMCPHRLAPLSEGRIDQWGRLQCVYHGWCFGGSGDCKFIPQAPPDGPPVHTSKKACVAIYPSTVQNGIVWFWPNSDPQYKDILEKKKPPYIPEIDDPSYTKQIVNRDIPYGYEVLIENLMDPAHIPYAHYKIMSIFPPPETRVHADREGGTPIDMNVLELDVNGFTGKQELSNANFHPPCLFCNAFNIPSKKGDGSTSSTGNNKVPQRRAVQVFFCIPVSPGNSRLIWAFPINFGVWIDKLVPHWLVHLKLNLVIDSDLYLLHVEEQKIMEVGASNWQKACFVPTKTDAFIVGFRKWLNKYAGGGVDWRGKYTGALPPSPPKEKLMDRFRSHVLNCSSCKAAYKGLNALEVILQVISISLIGIVAAAKQNLMSSAMRITTLLAAVACFAASKWLAHFIYKNFHYHDYNHTSV